MQDKILDAVKALKDRTVLDARNGEDSFITFDFSRHANESTQDDSCLWICNAAWRLEKDEDVLITDDFDKDIREEVGKKISNLIGLKILKAEAIGICNDLTIEFEKGYFLKTFACFRNEQEGWDSWELYTCDGYVAEVGPGSIAKYIPSDTPVDD